MSDRSSRVLRLTGVGLLIGIVLIVGSLAKRARDDELSPLSPGWVDTVSAPESVLALPVADSLYGSSGRLRFKTLTPREANGFPGFVDQLGEKAIHTPAVHRVGIDDGENFALIVLRPFGEKRGASLKGYKLGYWPAERWIMARNYLNPDGFVEVTPQNLGLALSTHFRLGDFVTHDQVNVWPKYVVLREALIDKLELILADLGQRGVPVKHVVVLSGFRSPQYNERGVSEGMARASRHQYGDAADLIIDDDGDGRMDDLNKDGRIDLSDTDVILKSVERVERQHRELIGGLGLYHAMGPRGPFAHVDVRGTSARWDR
jgi:uncharacterized protein YcbK (DUF882 family)